MMIDEIWNVIPIASNYEASNLGNIRNKKNKTCLQSKFMQNERIRGEKQ